MAKKWYSFFVVTDEDRKGSAASETKKAPGDATPARKVTDVVPDAAVETAFAAPVTSPVSLDEIYASAQIAAPAHGYTILKVAAMLESEHIRSLPADVKKKSIMVALDAAGVGVDEIVQDAVHRDRALDTYERILARNIEALRARTDLDNKRLEEEIQARLAELKKQIEENSREVDREEQALVAWRDRKMQEEERIARAVGYFVSENPISTTQAPQQEEGGADHVR